MSENIYAPPASIDSTAESDALWYVEGLTVFAKNGTKLPAIDLETGAEHKELVQIKKRITILTPLGGLACGAPGVCAIMVLSKFPLWLKVSVVGIHLAFCIHTGFRSSWKISQKFEIRYHRQREAELAEKRFRMRFIFLLLLMIALEITAQIYLRGEPALAALIIGVMCLLGFFYAAYRNRSRLSIRLDWQGRVRIKGVHNIALAKLRDLEKLQALSSSDQTS